MCTESGIQNLVKLRDLPDRSNRRYLSPGLQHRLNELNRCLIATQLVASCSAFTRRHGKRRRQQAGFHGSRKACEPDLAPKRDGNQVRDLRRAELPVDQGLVEKLLKDRLEQVADQHLPILTNLALNLVSQMLTGLGPARLA